MRILPVLDLLGNVVVRGVAGRRHEYRPVVSQLTPSADPLDVASAFQGHFGLEEFYLADLDAITRGQPDLATYARLQARGYRLWVDAGVRGPADLLPLVRAGVARVVLGLETLPGPEAVAAILQEITPDKVVFSLDLHEGSAFGLGARWPRSDPWEIGRAVVQLGIRSLLILDLARVGTGRGTGTEDLCRRFRQTYPDLELLTGGGIRDAADLHRVASWGVNGVLVASALHDGTLHLSQELPR